MNIQTDHSLKQLNTFGIDVKAKYFVEVDSLESLQTILSDEKFKHISKLFLGGGSNILFTKDYDGLVIKNNIKGIELVDENRHYVYVKAYSGELWHELVLHCIKNYYAGIENLSLIPGSVGAAPIQNIGAYGVEVKDVFQSLEAIDIKTGELKTFSVDECQFDYRNSIFKNELKGKYFILSLTLRLNKKPNFKVDYGAIKDILDEMNVNELSIKTISDAIIKIRKQKLPDPAEIGNAGSFFKNPEIDKKQYDDLKASYSDIPGYPVNDKVKVPAGWLIEQCGWKGKQIGETGTHKNQALVLVNRGNAKGEEIKVLAFAIQKDVKEKFGIEINPEVNLV